MDQVQKIKSIVEDALLATPELFLVDVVLKGNSGNQKLIVLIDGDDIFNIDQCAVISRKVAAILEDMEIFDGKYVLEVSSPGLDMPLSLFRQFPKHIGRVLKVEMPSGEKLKGELVSAEDNVISLRLKNQDERVMKLEQIKNARVEVSFS